MKQVNWQKVLVTAMCGSLLLSGSPVIAGAEENQPGNVENNVLVDVEEAEGDTATTSDTGENDATEDTPEAPAETTTAEADSQTETEPAETTAAAMPETTAADEWLARAPEDIQITGATYVVQRGDTLWAISEASGVSIETLLSLNPQTVDRNLIYTGETLTISAS